MQLQHGDVVLPVVADQVGGEALAADRGADRVRALDDVIVGQHLTAGRQHDAGADAVSLLVVDNGVDPRDRGLDLGGHRLRVTGRGNGRR